MADNEVLRVQSIIERKIADLYDSLSELDSNSQMMSEDEFLRKYDCDSFRFAFRTPVPLKGCDIYRARLVSSLSEEEDITNPQVYSYIPTSKSHYAKRGRMNRTAQSMFYGSLSPNTNFLEIKHDIKAGEEVFLSRWKIKEGVSLSVFPVYLPENIDVNADIENKLAVNDPFFADGDMGRYFRKLSSLFTRTDEDEKYRYLCSSFLANYILRQRGQAIPVDNGLCFNYNYDAILYPSARIGAGEITYSNLVIPPSVVDENLELVYVIRGRLQDDLSSVTSETIGFYETGKIVWYELESFVEDMVITNINVIDENGTAVNFSNQICTDKDDVLVSQEALLREIKNRVCGSILESIAQNNLFKNTITYNTTNSKNDILRTIHLVCIWPVSGWSIDNTRSAKHIQFEIKINNKAVIVVQ